MVKKLFYILLFITGLAFAGTSVTWNGSSYTVPSVGEENWFGTDKVDGLLIGLANDGFQKTGGAFTLLSEVDFGATAGLVASYWGTRSANDSTSGVFRLSNNEYIGWRNAGNSANLLLGVDTSNNLTFNGFALASSSGVVPVSSGGTGLTSYAVGDLVYATPNSQTLTSLPVGTANYVIKSNGTVPQYGQIVNASVDSSAAIDRSKLGSGTAGHVVINSGAGAFSSEAQLAVSRGGTNIGSYTQGDLLYASDASTLSKLPIGSSGQVIKSNGTVPGWAAAGVAAAVTTKTATYTVTSNDDVVFVSPTVGTLIAELPAASANSGKIFHFKRIATANTHVAKVSPATGDTIDDGGALVLGVYNQFASIVSDGGTKWKVISRGAPVAPTQQRFTSGSGTYTTASGALYLRVRMCGGGGGGAGSGTASQGSGGNGGNTTFGGTLLVANGGTGATGGATSGGTGGTASLGTGAIGTATTGGRGHGTGASSGTASSSMAGGQGGANEFAGAGSGGGQGGAGGDGVTNTGGGGGGAGTGVNTGTTGGAGGGAGGFVDAIIASPSASYAYSVGTSGSSGSAGTNGSAGGAGAAGCIEVTEYYQ